MSRTSSEARGGTAPAWALVLTVLLGGCKPAEPPLVPDPNAPDGLVAGELPTGSKAAMLLAARCVTCHSLDYVTQQRLTAAQWERSVAKMIRWGAPLDEEDAKTLVVFLAERWAPELPDRAPIYTRAPRSAVTAP